MLTRKYFGRCSIRTKAAGLMLVTLLAASFAAADGGESGLEIVLDVVEGSWGSLVDGQDVALPLDEQIFTDISPIVATDESVRLPQDQAEQ